VASTGDSTVSVIDAVTNSVIGTVPVGDEPVDVAVNPVDSFVYTANYGDDSVSVIDMATDGLYDEISLPTGSGPTAVAVNSSGTDLYVSEGGNRQRHCDLDRLGLDSGDGRSANGQWCVRHRGEHARHHFRGDEWKCGMQR